MYKNDKNQEEQNFWISYADLMAGLLFVFVLLVGAIVVRYIYVQQDLAQKRDALGLSENALSDKNKKLQILKIRLQENVSALARSRREKDTLAQDINLKNSDISKLKDLILDYERDTSEMQTKVATIEANLSQNQNILALRDDEIVALSEKLLEQSRAHQLLVDELNITKVKIKNLTGIRIKVVSKLKDTLGNSIQIDPKSGAIRFSSNILFNQGKYTLKAGAKKELSVILKKYIHTLLFDENIRDYIDNITIEGYTDTDGSYLYNLALSQKRALEVMKFLYTSDSQNRELYSRYLSASGRSYADLIHRDNGLEDKDASRRIEIKFRIKNEKSIKELETFLNR
ncbi:MAG TPA: chemotaxis protein [Campylobacterales bacterium]|nr:chemotaxis protein [Campylobacterales bacterium]